MLRPSACSFRGRYVFNWGTRGGGGPGLWRGGSPVKCFQIGEGQTCFVRNRGRITIFGKEKILHVASFKFDSFVSKHSKSLEN